MITSRIVRVAIASGLLSLALSFESQAQWGQVDSGLTSTNVSKLIVSGANLFAGAYGRGVFVSTNNGANWNAVDSGLTDLGVRSLAVCGLSLFAGTYGSGVFRSTNNGMSWSAVNTGLTNLKVQSLFVSGTNIFAGTYSSGGVWISTNNGTSWTAANSGLSGNGRSFTAIGTNLFVATDDGIFVSNNNGVSWARIGASLGNDTEMLTCFDVAGTNLFAEVRSESPTPRTGLLLSTDNGTTWTHADSGLPIWVVSFVAIGTNIFVGTDGFSFGYGVFRSTNNGTSWTAVNYGLASTCGVYALAVSGSNLFAGTNSGVWRIDLSEALPIQLSSFKAALLSTGVALSWSTVSETNNYGFYVQRNGTDVTFIAGHGTSIQQHSYSYTDNPCPGRYQYQLKQVDLDGTATLSESVVVDVTAPTKFALKQNYPNPFNPSTQITFSITKDGPVSLNVYDVLGREVTTLVNENRKAGQYTEQFIGNQVASGMYVYVLRSAEGQLVGRMMMLK
jgi:hypothetical protein